MTAPPWDPERLGRRLGIPVVAHDVVDSTMDEGRAAGPTPRLHVAGEQRAGRGRHGRVWSSPSGNLYATVVWPDPDELLGTAVLAAIQSEMADAIRGAEGPAVRCKWPNDGFVAGRKWSGLLAERDGRGGLLRIGLGANLEAAPEATEPEATALLAHWPTAPGSDEVAGLILGALLEVLRDGATGVRRGLARWSAVDVWTIGDALRIEGPGGVLEGRYRGIATDGRLVFEGDRGPTLIAAGDARRIRRRDA